MQTAISIEANSFRFDTKKILLIIAIVSFAFIVTNYIVAWQAAEQIKAFTVDDAFGVADEIYNNGNVADALATLPLDAVLIKKLTEEIERQLAKTIDYPGCEVYFLRVRFDGKYPVLDYGGRIVDYVFLRAGEVWKVGMTKNGEKGRYPRGIYYVTVVLDETKLLYDPIEFGNFKEIITLEKVLIYTYPVWSGHIDLIKPPGCKIYR